jgi:hypothetical protein
MLGEVFMQHIGTATVETQVSSSMVRRVRVAKDTKQTERAALRSLARAFDNAAQRLAAAMDQSARDIDELLYLARQLDWVSHRRSLIRTAEGRGPEVIAYVFADCAEAKHVASLADEAVALLGQKASLPAALNLLNYIDLEMGWRTAA